MAHPAATGVIFPYGNGTVFVSHFAKGSLRYTQTLRFPDASFACLAALYVKIPVRGLLLRGRRRRGR